MRFKAQPGQEPNLQSQEFGSKISELIDSSQVLARGKSISLNLKSIFPFKFNSQGEMVANTFVFSKP